MTTGREAIEPESVRSAETGAAVSALALEQDRAITDAASMIEDRLNVSPSMECGPVEIGAAGVDSSMTAALIEVAIGLQDLAAKQDDLRELFESRIRSEEIQTKALERLDDQVRDYKANFIHQQMQPLLRDFIYCYDYAADEVERAERDGPPATPQETARAFDHLRQMVADVLSKYDVEPYRVPGPEFDRRQQQCVRTVPTAIEADEKKVASVGAIGFRLADQIIRKEQVTVYKYSQPRVDRDP